MKAAVVLLNRDLRVHDQPALAEAQRLAEEVVPLFVFDDAILRSRFSSPNKVRFLLQSLSCLRQALRHRGADLVLRRGDPVAEAVGVAVQVGAGAVLASADVGSYAQGRQARLRQAAKEHRLHCALLPGMTIVAPDALEPAGSDHYRVFTPYWRAWCRSARRPLAPTPRSLRLPGGLAAGRLPELSHLVRGSPSPGLPEGGEEAGRKAMASWVRRHLEGYDARHDDLAADATSRISPYLHFGCLSPLEVAAWASGRPGAEPFIRQLCWRDFHHQVAAAFPALATRDYRSRGDLWRCDPEAVEAWKQGRTGFPIVDAGMRQLRAEGWMHNRARLIVASFLTKDLRVDWRVGAAHFLDWLVDGDIASNSGNWQWVAGTGNDTRPNRVLNPLRQAARFDPDGAYVRRYLPELADVEGRAAHEPWKLPPSRLRALNYPPPILDHDRAAAAFRRERG